VIDLCRKSQQKTLLLIDGSQVLMDLTRRLLERAGFSVRLATGMARAREWLAEYTPDGIVLASDLPDGNGLDYCRELRKSSGIPILFTSGDREDELSALEAGANDFLRKPCDYGVMIARLGLMLNGRAGTAELSA
jgi:DNA-binding response OmpR family regulator